MTVPASHPRDQRDHRDEANQQSATHGGLRLKLLLSRESFHLDVDLELPSRGITVLFGPSGSGKTTLLRCVAGLERPQGTIAIGSRIWLESATNLVLPTWSRDLGVVFQEASLFEHLNVRDNLLYGVRRARKAGSERALAEALELLGIAHLLNRDTFSLSGGERQRVAIARALATQPGLLLLDEPLASLDIARRQEILPWLERLHRQLSIPVLYVTHSMEELARLADHVVLLSEGQVRMHGPVEEVLCDPAFASIAGGEAGAMLRGVVTGADEEFHLSRIDVDGDTLWTKRHDQPTGESIRMHVHANHVSLSLEKPTGSSIQNCLPGTVESISDDLHPGQVIIRVRCTRQFVLARVTRRALTELGLAAGKPVWLHIKSAALA
jgi:molybdate transport system ATP-binding protein